MGRSGMVALRGSQLLKKILITFGFDWQISPYRVYVLF